MASLSTTLYVFWFVFMVCVHAIPFEVLDLEEELEFLGFEVDKLKCCPYINHYHCPAMPSNYGTLDLLLNQALGRYKFTLHKYKRLVARLGLPEHPGIMQSCVEKTCVDGACVDQLNNGKTY